MAKKAVQLKKAKAPVKKTGGFSMFGKALHFVKSKATKRRVIFVVVLLLVAGGIAFSVIRKNAASVETTTVQKGTIKEELILSGEVKAEKYVQMTFPVGGKIAWVGVAEGDTVRKGQALSSIDSTTLDAAYQQARATLRKYEATVDYVHDSLKDKATTETYSERDTRTTAEVNKDYAYDAFRAAEYNLKNAMLYAPFAGVVTQIGQTSPGVNIMVTETQIELLDPATIYFEVTADQDEIVNIKNGDQVAVVLDSFSDKELKGLVSYVGFTPKEGESSTVYEIKIKLTEGEYEGLNYKLGMTGDAKFVLSQKDDALYVPNNFVNSDKNGKYVYLGNKKNKLYIKVGIEGEENTEIVGDVKEGDKLVD